MGTQPRNHGVVVSKSTTPPIDQDVVSNSAAVIGSHIGETSSVASTVRPSSLFKRLLNDSEDEDDGPDEEERKRKKLKMERDEEERRNELKAKEEEALKREADA